jgi:hypothetical protein
MPGQGNNLDALQLGAASMVMLGHSFILVGHAAACPAMAGIIL